MRRALQCLRQFGVAMFMAAALAFVLHAGPSAHGHGVTSASLVQQPATQGAERHAKHDHQHDHAKHDHAKHDQTKHDHTKHDHQQGLAHGHAPAAEKAGSSCESACCSTACAMALPVAAMMIVQGHANLQLTVPMSEAQMPSGRTGEGLKRPPRPNSIA